MRYEEQTNYGVIDSLRYFRENFSNFNQCPMVGEKALYSNFSLHKPRVRVLGSKWDRILSGVTARVRVMG